MRIPSGVALALTVGIACASGTHPRPAAEPAPAPEPAMVPSAAASLETAPPAAAPAADLFQSDVKPLLMKRCSPCHAPGGKMYASMPFDAPATVREHQAGILRRLKADGAPIERWLASDAR